MNDPEIRALLYPLLTGGVYVDELPTRPASSAGWTAAALPPAAPEMGATVALAQKRLQRAMRSCKPNGSGLTP
ncbi:hypothetical protein [Hymenobacter glacialis]|uniref:Uncharacterized protein n=1 Tax=Hymenobacter glacialis TaxID=1908236 RepID=A0A1G1SRR1_9BACT|nr:hypothetical protein [Hymenobacter glacialis]OGX81320.1 hypothetical protein BEN48_06955 [Hymenobacter glacialis]